MRPISIVATAMLSSIGCIPSNPNDLIGESDRPFDPVDAYDFNTGYEDESLEEGVGNDFEEDPSAVELQASIVEVSTLDITEAPTDAIFLYIDEDDHLQIEHTLQWDDMDIEEIITSQEDTTIEFDYGEHGDQTRWLMVHYTVDISFLTSGEYTVLAENDEAGFTKP